MSIAKANGVDAFARATEGYRTFGAARPLGSTKLGSR
jgi:hypothetical protein